MLINTPSTKRRRYIRYAIELDAELLVERAAPTPCVILDFCSRGLFLGLKQPNPDVSLSDHQQINIHFSLAPDNSRKQFQLAGKIMHFRANGMGVEVEKMPAFVFEALKKAAHVGLSSTSSARHPSSSHSISQDHFKSELKKMLDKELPQLLEHFFKYVGDELIRAYQNSPDFKSSSTIEDLITTIKINRQCIFSEYCHAILTEVEHMETVDAQKNSEGVREEKSLSLIEKDDFEDWLNLASVIRNLTNDYKERIRQIDGKLRHVFGRTDRGVKNPISPGALCDAFREIILQFNLSNTDNLKLYNIFQNLLSNSLGHLYDEFDKVLENSGAPSQITPQVIKQPESNSLKSKRNLPGQAQTVISNDDLVNLLQLAEQSSRPPLTIAKRMWDIIKDANPGSASEFNQSLSEPGENTSAYSRPVFSTGEVIEAISKIQQNYQQFNNLHQNPAALQKHLLANLTTADNQKTVSSSDIEQLEVYGKFFETMFNDLQVSSEIKSYMENIQLSLLSRSLQGDDFLASESHPARNVVNQLATLEAAVKNSKLLKKGNIKNTLDKLIARIASEAGANPDIFAEVEQELQEVTEQVTKAIDLNISRIVASYEGRQKLESARYKVQQALDNRITGKPIPSVLPALLTSGWQHLLVIIELNPETTQAEKSKYYQVIDDLLHWLSDHKSTLEQQRETIEQTLAFIKDQLGTVCANAFQLDKIIDELSSCLILPGSLNIRKALGQITLEPSLPDQKDQSAFIDDHWMLQAGQLQVGDWLTVFRNSAGFEPMKLVWYGDLPPIFVFANRDGQNKLECTKAELAELMRNGAANKIENLDEPLMDRATNAMLQKMQETLIYNATHDPVTDLLTREEFAKQFKHEISLLANSSHVLCHVEVQDFRMIANSCGLAGGNQLLKKITHILTSQIQDHMLFSRLGDKTFGILFKHCSPDEGYDLAKKILAVITEAHFEWEDKSYPINVNIGLAPVINNGYDVNQLMQQADSASISAKESGHNRIQLFKENDEKLKRQKKIHEWAGQIDRVLAESRIFIRCQKIAAAEPDNHDFAHYEILMGVKDIHGNYVPPDHFIPAAESCQRMAEIDQWIIRHVFRWIEQHRNFFDQLEGFSINLSGQTINNESFLAFLKDLLTTSSIPCQKITFEITETVAANSLVYVKNFIYEIKQFGCKFSLDDFGSGYSSYSYLKNLNVDYLKIDGAFVKDMAANPADVAIVKSMNEIAHSLSMKTIAEYVENDQIRNILRDIGVDYVQGYGIQKPILLDELDDLSLSRPENSFSEQKTPVDANITDKEPLAGQPNANDTNLSVESADELTELISKFQQTDSEKPDSFNENDELFEDQEFWGF